MNDKQSIMIGPSGFFLPTGPGSGHHESNDIELLHSSEDGFSELYRVCKNGRFFVYKALKKQYRGNLMYEDLLSKDFNIGFSLTHPGLCQYFAKIRHPETGSCIVMEWIDGCTLEELIATGDVDKSLAEKIICEICDALGYMHRRQVIHRDLKPENILVTHNGQNVKIIDFGLSDADSFAAFKAPAGTRIYASPELLAGEPIDSRSDIWSLGVIIGEMHPYYRKVAEKCLVRVREKRFASVEEVKNAIQHERARKFWMAVLWVAAIVVAATLATGIASSYLTELPSASTSEPQQKAEISSPVRNDADSTLVTAPQQTGQPAPQTETKSHNAAHKSPKKASKTTVDDITETHIEVPEQKTEENIDAEALENLFKETAGQIL